MPAPVAIAWVVGITLVVAGVALLVGFRVRMAAAGAGIVLLLLVVCFYGPLLVSEFHTDPVEGLNYFADTLLFAGTVLLAGLEAGRRGSAGQVSEGFATDRADELCVVRSSGCVGSLRFAAPGDQGLVVKAADGLASGVSSFVASMWACCHDDSR
jgi:hypothetical protein